MKKTIIILILILILITACTPQKPPECQTNKDCVPAACCHPSACIPKEKAPNCTGIFCSMECRPHTMDCGAGYCACKDNKCTAVIS